MADTERLRTAVDAKRGTLFHCDPDQLTLITDPSHPLYDPRVKLPVPEWLIESVAAHGVVEPVIARKNGKLLEIVDGRQRYRAAVEANRRGASVKVQTILRGEDDAEAAVTMIVTNEHRQDDDIVTKAKKAAHLLKHGHSPAAVCSAFRITKPTLKAWEAIGCLAPAVKEAIANGAIGATQAVKELAGLTREEQPAALEKLLAARPPREPGAPRPYRETPARRLKLVGLNAEFLTPRERCLIAFIQGEADVKVLAGSYSPLAEAIRKEARK